MINKVTLIGNLGQDPEVRRLENGTAVAKLNLATNESYKDKNGEWQKLTEWHNVVLWRWLAERAEQTLKKGSLVYIEGKLTNRKYQDKDGNDRYITEVVANNMKLMEKREGAGTYSSTFPGADDVPPQIKKTNTESASTATATTTEAAPATEAAEDDLPF